MELFVCLFLVEFDVSISYIHLLFIVLCLCHEQFPHVSKESEAGPICVKSHLTILRGSNSWPLSCWTQIYPAFVNSVDPDQLASEEANWSGSALFAIKCVNL